MEQKTEDAMLDMRQLQHGQLNKNPYILVSIHNNYLLELLLYFTI